MDELTTLPLEELDYLFRLGPLDLGQGVDDAMRRDGPYWRREEGEGEQECRGEHFDGGFGRGEEEGEGGVDII